MKQMIFAILAAALLAVVGCKENGTDTIKDIYNEYTCDTTASKETLKKGLMGKWLCGELYWIFTDSNLYLTRTIEDQELYREFLYRIGDVDNQCKTCIFLTYKTPVGPQPFRFDLQILNDSYLQVSDDGVTKCNRISTDTTYLGTF